MRRYERIALFLLLFLAAASFVSAQEVASAQQSVEALRSQLQEIEAKQAALETRSRELDEAMRPENIERGLALTGSTRPEELRAQRRAQLEKEKASVQSQLDQLSASHSRVQASLAAAETAAYQQSGAAPATTSQTQAGQSSAQTQTQSQSAGTTQPRSNRRRARRAKVRRRAQ